MKLGFISDSKKISKLTSPFGVMIVQMWLALFIWSLQMVSESLNNDARSCSTGALHDMALTWTLGV
jgi:hypothetical protein